LAFPFTPGTDIVAAAAQIRIQLRVPEYGWTTQKVFHLLNFLVAGLRAGVFASWDHVRFLSCPLSPRLFFHVQSA